MCLYRYRWSLGTWLNLMFSKTNSRCPERKLEAAREFYFLVFFCFVFLLPRLLRDICFQLQAGLVLKKNNLSVCLKEVWIFKMTNVYLDCLFCFIFKLGLWSLRNVCLYVCLCVSVYFLCKYIIDYWCAIWMKPALNAINHWWERTSNIQHFLAKANLRC